MINLSFSLNLPLCSFKELYSKCLNVTSNHVIEIEIHRTQCLVGLSLYTRCWGDHRGFDVGFSLLFVDLMLSFYDTRHAGE